MYLTQAVNPSVHKSRSEKLKSIRHYQNGDRQIALATSAVRGCRVTARSNLRYRALRLRGRNGLSMLATTKVWLLVAAFLNSFYLN